MRVPKPLKERIGALVKDLKKADGSPQTISGWTTELVQHAFDEDYQKKAYGEAIANELVREARAAAESEIKKEAREKIEKVERYCKEREREADRLKAEAERKRFEVLEALEEAKEARISVEKELSEEFAAKKDEIRKEGIKEAVLGALSEDEMFMGAREEILKQYGNATIAEACSVELKQFKAFKTCLTILRNDFGDTRLADIFDFESEQVGVS